MPLQCQRGSAMPQIDYPPVTMVLPEFVMPVLSIAGPAAPTFVVLRFGPDTVLRLLAGTVAVLTRDEKRGKRCLEVLHALRGRDGEPPSLP